VSEGRTEVLDLPHSGPPQVDEEAEPVYFDRWDMLAIIGFAVVAFVLRFYSPIMPDFFLHPFQGPLISNCVHNTPIDPQGDPGTLCGLAYPFNRGYSSDWKLPPYDPERAKKLLAEAGHGGGFDVRVNPYVQLVAQDGPDVMEAVALDWEKVGLKVKRVPEATSSFGPKMRLRKSNKTFSVYGSPPYDEPVAGWERVIHSKAAFNLLLDGTYDEDIDVAMRELDPDKRARLTHDLGQKLYDGYHGVMLGMKSITWAVSRKVGAWTTLAYVPAETNYESVTPNP